MRILKQSTRPAPKVSLILLDWRVRESFHLLHYLKSQTVARESFEVIVVEYYDHISPAVQKFESEVDTWLLLQMSDDCYYHKHLMYNAGILFSRGDILMFGDSDAMVRSSFIQRIITSFQRDPFLVYHMDEFRNVRRDLYPFNYPSFEEVLGDGCINNVDGRTSGVLDVIDPIHTRNYGACMCGRRQDIISLGGADEDLSYLGHVCGPYDMTFRLMNSGRRLKWDTEEYLYHTWHPGTDGTDNYLGPHDGMNMSTTALRSLSSGRILPLVENSAIRELRNGGQADREVSPGLLSRLIDPTYTDRFSRAKLSGGARIGRGSPQKEKHVFASYKGFDIYQVGDVFYGVPDGIGAINVLGAEWHNDDRVIIGKSFGEIRTELDSCEARLIESVKNANICAVGKRFAIVPHALGPVDFRIRRQRADTRICWEDTLAEARRKALTLTDVAPEAPSAIGEADVTAVRSVATAAVQSDSFTSLAQDVVEIKRSLARLEADVLKIYRSRIWRTLVKIGGILDTLIGRTKLSSR
jgi:hypothetical protein